MSQIKALKNVTKYSKTGEPVYKEGVLQKLSPSTIKQLAGKVIARTCWRLDDVLAGWDGISMRSWAVTDGKREPYQDCTLGQILSPKQLIDGFTGGGALQPGTMMMSGTPAAIGGIRPAGRFEMELADAATGRNIRHGYDIVPVDVVA